jgi:hypothetical protein
MFHLACGDDESSHGWTRTASSDWSHSGHLVSSFVPILPASTAAIWHVWMCVESMPEWCDMIIGRTGIFNVLRGSIERDALKCYTLHQPTSDGLTPLPTEPSMWKFIPFTEATALPSIAIAELCNVVLPLGTDGDEMMITDQFSADYEACLEDYVTEALNMVAKNRTMLGT